MWWAAMSRGGGVQRRRRSVVCVLRRRVLFKSHIMLNIQPIYVDHDAYISNRLGVMLRVTQRDAANDGLTHRTTLHAPLRPGSPLMDVTARERQNAACRHRAARTLLSDVALASCSVQTSMRCMRRRCQHTNGAGHRCRRHLSLSGYQG